MLAVKLALWVLFALAIVAVGYSGVALVVATWLSTPSRQPEERTPQALKIPYALRYLVRQSTCCATAGRKWRLGLFAEC